MISVARIGGVNNPLMSVGDYCESSGGTGGGLSPSTLKTVSQKRPLVSAMDLTFA